MKYGLNQIYVVFGIGLFFSFSRMIIGGFSALYLLTKGLSYGDIALLKSFQALIILFSDIPLGYVSDKFSRKYTLMFAIFFGFIWLFLTAIAQHKSTFYLAELFNALSLALFSGGFMAFLIEKFKTSYPQKNVKEIISSYHMYNFSIMAFATFIGGTFFSLENNLSFLSASLLCFMVFILGLVLIKNDSNQLSSINTLGAKRKKGKNLLGSVKKDIKIFCLLFKKYQEEFVYLLITYLLIIFFYQIVIQYWQILFEATQMFSDNLTQAVSYFFVLILLMQSLAGYINKKFNYLSILRLAVIGLFITTLIFLASFKLSYPLISILCILGLFLSLRCITTALESTFHNLLYNTIRATFDSIMSTLNRLLLIVILPLIGFLMLKYGEVVIIYSAIIVAILSIGFTYLAYKYKRNI
jgi:MFS family permease